MAHAIRTMKGEFGDVNADPPAINFLLRLIFRSVSAVEVDTHGLLGLVSSLGDEVQL